MNQRIEDVIIFLIDQTAKKTRKFGQKEFDKHGMDITTDQWVLLKIIEEDEGISQKQIGTLSYRDGASITRTLDLLAKKDLIIREPIPENRRQHRVFLTDEGRQFVAEHMALVSSLRARSLEGFSNEDIEQLKSLLQKIQLNVS